MIDARVWVTAGAHGRHSLVPRPRSPRGEGSGDICAVCWLCKVSNSVTLPQCYVIHHNIYMRANMYVAMQQDA